MLVKCPCCSWSTPKTKPYPSYLVVTPGATKCPLCGVAYRTWPHGGHVPEEVAATFRMVGLYDAQEMHRGWA